MAEFRPAIPAAVAARAAFAIESKMVWEQDAPILDVSTSGDQMLVLDTGGVSLYGRNSGKWERTAAAPIPVNLRDPRGRLEVAGDTLTVTFNSDGTSKLAIAGVDDTTAGDLAIAASVSWGDATAGDANIQIAVDDLTAALATVRTQSKAFGSSLSTVEVRQDFTKAMINTLQAGADNLTLADSNEEGANLLALQTRQQLSTTALSLAAQADQNVLRLFQ